MKTCKTCGIAKQDGDFYRQSGTEYLYASCKPCHINNGRINDRVRKAGLPANEAKAQRAFERERAKAAMPTPQGFATRTLYPDDGSE